MRDTDPVADPQQIGNLLLFAQTCSTTSSSTLFRLTIQQARVGPFLDSSDCAVVDDRGPPHRIFLLEVTRGSRRGASVLSLTQMYCFSSTLSYYDGLTSEAVEQKKIFSDRPHQTPVHNETPVSDCIRSDSCRNTRAMGNELNVENGLGYLVCCGVCLQKWIYHFCVGQKSSILLVQFWSFRQF